MGRAGRKGKRSGPEGKKIVPKTVKKDKGGLKSKADVLELKKTIAKTTFKRAVAQKKAEVKQKTLTQTVVKEGEIKEERKRKAKKSQKDAKKPKILTKEDRKQQLKERKAAKPNAELVAKANQWWAAPKKKKEKRPVIDQLLEDCKTKFAELANKHDTSRVLQRLIKHGTGQQRAQLFAELKGKIATDFITAQYGHHVVLKFLEWGVQEMKDMIAEELKGKTPKLLLHKEAAAVIDYMYSAGSKKLQAAMQREFFGKEFLLFDSEATLDDIVKETPEKLPSILDNLNKYLMRAADKGMLQFRPFHSLARRFLEHADGERREAMMGTLSNTPLALHHSEDGAYVLNVIIALGNAKCRKKIIKALKGQVADLCQHRTGFLLVAKLLDVVDDTDLLAKSILNEVIAALPDLVGDPHGCKVLLNVLRPCHKGYVTEKEAELLSPQLKDGASTSKKDPALRRRQLLQVLLGPLLGHCALQAAPMLEDKSACRILLETVTAADSLITDDTFECSGLSEKWPALLEALGAIGSEPIDRNLFQHPSGHWGLKNLFKLTQGPELHAHMSEVLLGEKIGLQTAGAAIAATNRGAFVLAALVEKLNKEAQAQWSKALNSTAKTIQSTKGGEVLAKLLHL